MIQFNQQQQQQISQLPQYTSQTVESQYIQQPTQMSIKPQPITFYPPTFSQLQIPLVQTQNYQMQQQQQQQQSQQLQQAQDVQQQLQYDDQQIRLKQLSQNVHQQIQQQQWNEQFQQMLQMHHHNYLLQNQLHNLMLNQTAQSEQARKDLMIQQQQSMADFTNLQPETITEYIPVEKKIIEYETRIKKIQVPVTHEITEYVPVTTETISPERTVRLSPPKEVHMVPTVVQQPPILQQTVFPRQPQLQIIHTPTQINRMPTTYQQVPLTSMRSQHQQSPPRILNKPTEIPIPPPPPHLPLQPFNYTPKDFPTMSMPQPPQQFQGQITLNSPKSPPPPQFEQDPLVYPHQVGHPYHQLPSHLQHQAPLNQFNQPQLNSHLQQHQINCHQPQYPHQQKSLQYPHQPYHQPQQQSQQAPLLPHPPQSRPAPFIPEQYYRDQIEDEQDKQYYDRPRNQTIHPDFQQTKHASEYDTPNYHIPNYDSENIRDKQSEPIQYPKRAPFIPKSYDPDLQYEKPEYIDIPSKDNQKRGIQRQVYEKRPQNAQQTLRSKENYFKDSIFQ